MKILVIPDPQCKPGVSLDHMEWAGKYAVDKKPDVIVNLGDHWDMPSLSSYDKSTKRAEGRTIQDDIDAGKQAMQRFLEPIRAEQDRLVKGARKRWNPRLVFLIGNHEERIMRHVNANPNLHGLLSYDNLGLKEMGWEVYDFLEVVEIGGVAFSHYFTSGVMGRPVSSPRVLLGKGHMSAVMGHVQDCSVEFSKASNGLRMTGIFAGIFYQHDEEYLGKQNNGSWRGLWVLHDVERGQFDHMMVSMQFLKHKYGDR